MYARGFRYFVLCKVCAPAIARRHSGDGAVDLLHVARTPLHLMTTLEVGWWWWFDVAGTLSI